MASVLEEEARVDRHLKSLSGNVQTNPAETQADIHSLHQKFCELCDRLDSRKKDAEKRLDQKRRAVAQKEQEVMRSHRKQADIRNFLHSDAQGQ